MKQQLLSNRLIPIWLICAYFLLIALFVSLSGNFPLNDDWAYAEGVRIFLKNGKLLLPVVCAPSFTHVFLGVAFCKLFGFSYVVLRSMVFVIGLIGSIVFYITLREIGTHRNAAIFCSLLYASNPLMVNLYFSFMSDVTSTTLIIIYLFILFRAIKKNSLELAILSIVLFALAIGARQSVVIFTPCNLALLSIQTKNRGLLYSILAASLVIPILCYISTDYWLTHRVYAIRDYADVKQGHAQFVREAFCSPLTWLYKVLVGLGQTTCYMGLFCLPILLSFILRSKRLISKYISQLWVWILLAACTIFISVKELALTQHKLMPFNQNLLRLPMVCALTIMGLNMPLLSNKNLRWVTIISFILAFVLVTIIGSLVSSLVAASKKFINTNASKKSAASIFSKRLAITWICVITVLVSLGFSVTETIVRCTDRYYMIGFAPLILALAWLSRRVQVKVVHPLSILTLVLIAIYGACAAQDYLGWNRARWLGLEQLEAQGIPSSDIDGGYEYNTVRDMKIYDSTNHGTAPQNKWRWWAIKGEKYIVSFSPIPNYKIIGHLPYWSALTFSKLEVLILQRESN